VPCQAACQLWLGFTLHLSLTSDKTRTLPGRHCVGISLAEEDAPREGAGRCAPEAASAGIGIERFSPAVGARGVGVGNVRYSNTGLNSENVGIGPI
jgi:hypothetical protein